MRNITIHFKDGTSREFVEKGRAGGSYTISVRYEGGFVIVQDEYYNTNSFPGEIVKEVQTRE